MPRSGKPAVYLPLASFSENSNLNPGGVNAMTGDRKNLQKPQGIKPKIGNAVTGKFRQHTGEDFREERCCWAKTR